jgi:hypothetical protein
MANTHQEGEVCATAPWPRWMEEEEDEDEEETEAAPMPTYKLWTKPTRWPFSIVSFHFRDKRPARPINC